MSIVTIHGPNTWGSRAIVESGALIGVVSPTNGLIWDFGLDRSTTRSNQDFSWAFPADGTPTPQVLANPTAVTYAAAGSKTVTLTVTNTQRTVTNKALTSNVVTLTTSAPHGFVVGQSVTVASVDAAFDGTYVITSVPLTTTLTYAKVGADVTSGADTGTVTSAASQYPAAGAHTIVITAVEGTGPQSGLMAAPTSGGGNEEFDPGDCTVDEVKAYVEANPDQAQAVYDAEVEGKARVTLTTWLEEFEA